MTRLRGRCDIGNLNFDLIYGLPLQTVELPAQDMRRDRREALAGPHRLLRLCAHAPAQGQPAPHRRNDAAGGVEERIDQAGVIAEEFLERRWIRGKIGIDHFARPGQFVGACRRHRGGCTAISKVIPVRRQRDADRARRVFDFPVQGRIRSEYFGRSALCPCHFEWPSRAGTRLSHGRCRATQRARTIESLMCRVRGRSRCYRAGYAVRRGTRPAAAAGPR